MRHPQSCRCIAATASHVYPPGPVMQRTRIRAPTSTPDCLYARTPLCTPAALLARVRALLRFSPFHEHPDPVRLFFSTPSISSTGGGTGLADGTAALRIHPAFFSNYNIHHYPPPPTLHPHKYPPPPPTPHFPLPSRLHHHTPKSPHLRPSKRTRSRPITPPGSRVIAPSSPHDISFDMPNTFSPTFYPFLPAFRPILFHQHILHRFLHPPTP